MITKTTQRICSLIVMLSLGLTIPAMGSEHHACLVLPLAPDEATGLPQGWEPLTFPKISQHTTYTVMGNAETYWVRADSHASASALVKELDLDPKTYPVLRWQWRVENIIHGGDARTKAGDDYAARVYVTFRYEPERASFWERAQFGLARTIYGSYPPKGALNYIWANKLPRGIAIENAYTSRAKMIAVQSGEERVGEWVRETRNIYQDYLALFGEEPPAVSGVAIMTDTDDTQETAVAYYGDIAFCRG